MQSTFYKDGAAVALSTACILHCIALPILAVSSPFLSAIADAEWVHWVMAVLAILASADVALSIPSAREPKFLLPAGLGAVLIAGALFAENIGLNETLLTVLGGILLASAHLYRIFNEN